MTDNAEMSERLLETQGIHPANATLRTLPREHIAIQVLVSHAQARVVCVGKEIQWEDGANAIEQVWSSAIDGKKWRFSSFAYAFISFDLVLDGWIDDEKRLQSFERDFVHELRRLRELLYECERAAYIDGNDEIRPLIGKAREFFSLFERSIIDRVGAVEIASACCSDPSLWATGQE